MTTENRRQLVEMILSWGRVFLAALIAQAMAGITDWQMLFNAGLAGVLPVILRWLDPYDKTFGRGSE